MHSARQTARTIEVLPVLRHFVLNKWLSPLAPLCGYPIPNLSAFLEHGEVDISNNFAGNAIRPFVVGRKNWLFCDSPKGADSSAIVYTLVETAKANGMDPYGYLLRVLSSMPYLGKNPSPEELDRMKPWSPEMRWHFENK